MEQQSATAKFGMWLFLVTEIMFFGGMFASYLIYRLSYYNAWVAGSQTMEISYGTANTAVLICSSLTMVMAVHLAKLGNRKLTAIFLLLTLILGLGFLGVKAVEYHEHWVHHEVPGANFHFEHRATTIPVRSRSFFAVLCHDRNARLAHDHRRRIADLAADCQCARPLQPGVQLTGGDGGAVLAFCRHRLDLPFSAALSDQPPPPRDGVGEGKNERNTHIPTIKTFVAVWAALLVLTAVTVFASTLELGPFNAIVALTIATVKALLVLLFFMELRYSTALTKVAAAADFC